jgi:PepSY-associated transmembrane protein
MAVLHTWTGVALGSVLFAIFWMGTLSVFDREIDRWMLPATRLGPPPPALSLDASVRPRVDRLAAGVEQWSVVLPTPRTPTLVFRYTDADQTSQSLHLDPVTGNVLPDAGSLGGTGFIFPFHFGLHLGWHDVGTWLVGLCGMAMLVLVVSGVVIHRRIFKDMFTFRPNKVLSRSSGLQLPWPDPVRAASAAALAGCVRPLGPTRRGAPTVAPAGALARWRGAREQSIVELPGAGRQLWQHPVGVAAGADRGELDAHVDLATPLARARGLVFSARPAPTAAAESGLIASGARRCTGESESPGRLKMATPPLTPARTRAHRVWLGSSITLLWPREISVLAALACQTRARPAESRIGRTTPRRRDRAPDPGYCSRLPFLCSIHTPRASGAKRRVFSWLL